MANTISCACCTDTTHTDSCDCGTDTTATCYCPLTGVINTLSKKYAMQIINIIGGHGTLRYGEIEDHLSVASNSTLSERLDELVDAGLLTRTQYDEIPPRVEYELTEDSEELREQLEPLLEWAANRP